MANETFTVVQNTNLLIDLDLDTLVDPGETVITTVTITNNSTNTDATGVQFTETLDRMTLVDQGNDGATTPDVNISPIAFHDSFTAIGNTLLEVGNATSQTGPQSSVAGSVVANDVEFFGDTFEITAVNGTAPVAGTVTITTANGGTVTMITSGADRGSFTYISDPADTGITDTFTYTITDKGIDGVANTADDLSSTAIVSINIVNQVWYVDNSYTGANGASDGSSLRPFTSLASLSGAAGPDGPGDIIYVAAGNAAYTGGIVLLDGQTLHGAGTALTVNGFTLAAAGSDPTITNAAGNGVTLASGNTLTGFTVGDTTGYDIANTTTATVGNLTISNVTLNGSGGLIRVDSGGTLNVQLDSATTASAGATGILLSNVDNSTFSVTGVTTINDATTDGISIGGSQNSTFTFGGKVTVLNDGVGANGDGVDLQSNAAVDSTFNFNGGVDITVNGAGAFGFRAQNSGIVNITDVDTTQITSNNGTALLINPTTFNATLDSVTSSGGSEGISLNGMSGSLTIGTVDIDGQTGDGIDISSSAGSITINGGTIGATNDPAGIGVDINGGTGNVTIGATINKTTAGDVVEVTGRSTGTVDFNGNITSTNGGGIDLNTNTGGTIRFDGGMTLSTGATAAFSATGNTGTTLVVTDPLVGSNILTTTTATALNVTNTSIGSEGLTFQSISSNGAVSGIILNNTGTGVGNGGLTVTGDATTSANGSGGVIQGSTGAGISLTSTRNVSLDQVNVTSGTGDGIHGVGVVNFTLDHSNITNNGDSTLDDGLQFGETSGSVVGVTGTVSILNSSISGNAHNNVHIRNTSGTIDSLIVTNSSFNDLNDTFGANAFLFEASGTSTVTEAFITGSTFSNNSPQRALEVQAHDTATISDFVVSGNKFVNNGIHASFTQDTSGNLEFYFINNGGLTAGSAMTGSVLQAVNVFSSSQSTGGTIVGTISGNLINTGAVNASGIEVVIQGQTDATLLIDGNTINNTSGSRGISVAFRGPADPLAATLGPNTVVSDVTITNNVVDNDNGVAFPLAAISVEADNQSGADNKAPTVRADIRGNTVPSGTAFDLTTGFLQFYEYDQAGAHGIGQLVDTAPANATANDQLASTNTGSVGSLGITLISGPINVPGPVPTPLLAAWSGVLPAGMGQGGVYLAPPAEAAPSTTATAPVQPDPVPPAAPVPESSAAAPQSSAAPAVTTPYVIVDDGVLSQAELDFFVDAAIERWAAAGLTAAQVAALHAMDFAVADMSGLHLGSFSPTVITLDSNAAGMGWYLDPTPLEDSEFGNVLSATRMQTDPTGAPAGHYDLLTTVMHEMGHVLGLADTYAPEADDDLMFGYLYLGERRVAADGAADGAVAGSITTEEFLGAPVTIGVLPFNQSVTIQWQATVDAQTNQLIDNPSNTGTVSATNAVGFADTDSNTVVTALDTLELGGTVWNDNGSGGTAGNGLKEGTEPGVDGVSVTLFTDTGSVAGVWDALDTQVGTSVLTSGGGNYSFTGLAPGEYIVRIDQDNFDAGGNVSLLNLQISPVTSPEPPDPDDGDPDVDNDDNGSRVPGQPAFSTAITLAYNTEPTAGTGNDTNTTVDFAFLANPPPEIHDLAGDTSTYTEEGTAVLLDDSSAPELAATVTDDQTHFNGGSLIAAVTAALPEDQITILTNDNILITGGNIVQYDADGAGGNPAVTIGTVADNGTPTLTVTFTTADATPAAVSALMQRLAYSNSNTSNPSTAQRTIAVTVNDGLTGVDSENVFVNVVDINDQPTLIAPANDPNFLEGGAAADIFGAPTASTVEAGQTFTSMTLTVTNVTDGANEILSFDGSDVTLTDGTTVPSTLTNNLSVSVGVVGTTATVTFSGATLSAAALQTLIDGLTYRNTLTEPTDGDRVVTVTELVDSGSNVAPADNTAALNVFSTVNVEPLNDAPTLTATSDNPTFTEGDPAVDLFDTVVASTIEAGQTFISLTLTVSNVTDGASEILNIDGSDVALTNGNSVGPTATNGLTVTVSLAATTATVTFSGASLSAAALQTLVDGLTYRNTSDDPTDANRTVTITEVVDSGGTLNGGDNSGALALASSVNVNPVNDEPTLVATGNNPTFTEGDAGADLFASVVAATPEAVQTFASMTLTVSNVTDGANEILVFDGSNVALIDGNVVVTATNGLTVTVSLAATTATVTFSGATLSVLQLQTLIDGLLYRNTSDNPTDANRAVTITELVDGGLGVPPDDNTASLAVVSTVNVNPANDAPTLGAVDPTADYTENGAATVLSNTTTVSDVDNTTLASATVRVTDFLVGDVLSANTAGTNITASYDGVGTLTLSGVDDLADYQIVLRSVEYSFSGDNPTNFNSDTTRTIEWTVNDGAADNGPLPQTTVTITALNDAPDLANVAANATYQPGTPPQTLSAGTTVLDADDVALESASAQITGGLFAGDELSVAGVVNGGPVNGISWTYTAATGLLQLTGTSSLANYQALLAQVQYRSTNADPTSGGANLTRTVTWIVNDGSASSVAEVTTVNLNTPPEIDLNGPAGGTGFATSFVENGAGVSIVDNAITIGDLNDPDLASATILLTNAQAGDVLTVGALDGLSIAAAIDTTVDGQITLTLTGPAPIAEFEEALRRVTFSNTSEDPPTVQRVLNISVSDGTLSSANAVTTINVTSHNDAPVNTVPGTQSVEANHSLVLTGLSVADVDAGAASITTSLSVAHGTLTVGSVGGGAGVAGSGTGTVVLTGTLAEINATLGAADNVVFNPTHDFFGTDTLTIVTNDGGNAGLIGGVQTDTDLVTINVDTLVTGTGGADSFNVLPGNSRADGLGGIDTMTFNFRLVDATVSYVGNTVIIDSATSHTVLTGFEVFVFTDGTVNNNDGNWLVDDLFYYSRYHDVWNAHLDAEGHYNTVGWHEGRDPDAFFSTSVYLSANSDVAAAGVNPLDHWHTIGWTEGRVPSISFDPAQYLAANPDVEAAHIDPLAHFLQFGAGEGRLPFAPSELVAANGFDYVFYLNNNPDVAAAGIDPFQHFMTVGWTEGRNPNALFDTNGYLANYPDVDAANINPLTHYDQFGWEEGRDPSVNFDTTSYLAAYPDVDAADVNPLTHFLHFGIHEGRSAFADGVWG